MTEDLAAAVRAAVQAVLDAAGDGYHAAQFVICMGLERINSSGELETAPWLWAPPSQPDWMTAGLLESAWALHQAADEDDDDSNDD